MIIIGTGVMVNASIAPSNEKESSIISRCNNIAKAALPTNKAFDVGRFPVNSSSTPFSTSASTQ